jgi:hypothetical protein
MRGNFPSPEPSVVVSRHPRKALYAYLRCFTGLVPSGLAPSLVLECGLISHRDGAADLCPARHSTAGELTRVKN